MQRPQFHVGAWPGGGAVTSLDEWFRGHIWAHSRSHAYTAGCFVIAAADPMTRENLTLIEEKRGPQPKLAPGGALSLVLDPLGNTMARHDTKDEKLVVAEADLDIITQAKLLHDSSGHSARPEILRLHVDTQPYVPQPGLPDVMKAAPGSS